MKANRYPGDCAVCGNRVAANAGTFRRAGRAWLVFHLACADQPAVMSVTFNSGATITRNIKGTCEDAPCCGCCTF